MAEDKNEQIQNKDAFKFIRNKIVVLHTQLKKCSTLGNHLRITRSGNNKSEKTVLIVVIVIHLFYSIWMEKYRLGSKLGDGSFGSVVKGIDEKTGQVVAIKRMKQ